MYTSAIAACAVPHLSLSAFAIQTRLSNSACYDFSSFSNILPSAKIISKKRKAAKGKWERKRLNWGDKNKPKLNKVLNKGNNRFRASVYVLHMIIHFTIQHFPGRDAVSPLKEVVHNKKVLTGSTVGRLESLLLFLLGPGIFVEWWPSSKSPPLTLLEGEVALRLLEPMESNFFYNEERCS